MAIRATLKLLASDSIEDLLVYRRSKVHDLTERDNIKLELLLIF